MRNIFNFLLNPFSWFAVFGKAKYWHKLLKLHRTDDPAVEKVNGDKYWFQNGQIHRLDGPAVEYADGIKEWWINGEYIKTCIPKILTIQENNKEKQIFICCAECAKSQGISEDRFYKLSLLL